MHEVLCAVCGVLAVRSKPAKYCSTECKGKRPRRHKRPSGKHPMKDLSCKACSAVFRVRGDNRKSFCSPECREDWRIITKPPASYTILIREKKKPIVHKCIDCDVVIEKEYGRRAICTTCRETRRISSIQRGKQASKDSGDKAIRRKSYKMKLRKAFVEHVDPFVVLSRDGWSCQMCGVSTPEKLRGSYEDNAPEVDHIIPISRGGLHSYENTQCLCRKCNIRKNNKLPEELIGGQA